MSKVYIFLADGFEETEAIATLDVIRRGGIEARTVSVQNKSKVTGSHGLTVLADTVMDEVIGNVGTDDVLVFPGGMPGSKTLAADKKLVKMMLSHYSGGGAVAAICAAPGLVLSQLPDIAGKKMTCFDGFEEPLIAKGAEYVKVLAVKDGNIITGRGAGCAIDFGLEIVNHISGPETVKKVRAGMMI